MRLLLLLLFFPLAALAQDAVEVDLDVLNDYAPPPMFEPVQRQHTPSLIQFIDPQDITTEPPDIVLIPPAPRRKPPVPQRYEMVVETVPADFAEPVREVEPDPLVIVRDIMREEQTQLAPFPEAQVQILEQELEKLDAQEILQTIDPDAALSDTRITQNNEGDTVIYYQDDKDALDDETASALNSVILAPLNRDMQSTLIIRAFAAMREGEKNSDRRIALMRGIHIRDYLVNNGIALERISIQALGQQSPTQPINRVELQIQ